MFPRKSSTTRKLFASLAILAAVGAFVSFGVFSNFSSTQSNASSLTAGTFGLGQIPSSGGLLDDILKLLPGDTITRCVMLTNSGNVPITVTANPSMSNTSGTLNSVAKLAIDEVQNVDTSGTGTTQSNHIKACTASAGNTVSSIGTVLTSTVGSSLSSLHPALTGSNGDGSWPPGDSHVYQIVETLPSSVTDPTFAGNTISSAVNFTATSVAGTAR